MPTRAGVPAVLQYAVGVAEVSSLAMMRRRREQSAPCSTRCVPPRWRSRDSSLHEGMYELPQQQRRDEEESRGRFSARDEVVGISERERRGNSRSQGT